MTRVQVEIERAAYGGEGVGRLPDGKVVFVRGALPGDTVDVEILVNKKKFARGDAVALIKPGPGRFASACPHTDELGAGCGGCHFQSSHYVAEWEWTSAAALEAFSRAGRLDLDGVDVQRFSSPAPEGYRRRLRVHIDAKGKVGFFRRGSHDIDGPASDCLVAHPTLRRAAEVLGLKGPGTALLELDADEDTVVVRAEVPKQDIPPLIAPIVGMKLQAGGATHTAGETQFDVEVRGLRRTLPVGVFTQANARMNDILVTRALTALKVQDGQRVLELYCGAGNFTLDIARQGGSVWGLDVGGKAITAGQAAAARHGLDSKIHLATANLRKGLPDLSQTFDAVLLDPPRSGAKDVMDGLVQLGAARVVYISCDAPTAGRDVQSLTQAGYAVEHVSLLDMFPRTSHVELVVALTR